MPADPKYGRARRRAGADTAHLAPNLNSVPRLFPWIPAILTFFVYMLTLSPGMQMGDGTELAAAAYVLGVPHPTGYPLYMLLCKLWLIITVAGDPIVRTTLLNAVFMSAAVGFTALILVDILRYLWQTSVDKSMLLWAGAGALTAGFLRFHWSNAVVTEVYALQFLIMVLFVRCFQKADLHGFITRPILIAATICLALGLAHHRLSITMIIPWLALWVIAWQRRGSSTATVRLPWFWAATVLIIGASLYAYIPLRAAAQPPINWGNATTFERFYNHVQGTEYLDRGLMKPALGESFSGGTLSLFIRYQTAHIFTDLVGQFVAIREEITSAVSAQKIFVTSSPLVLLAALLFTAGSAWGVMRLWFARQQLFAFALAMVAAQNIVILYLYNIPDIRDYFLLPLWVAWLGLFAFAAWLASRLPLPSRQLSGYLALLLPLAVLAGNWHRCSRTDDVSAEVLSAMILPDDPALMPPDSILITDDDSETFTTWYRQSVRGDRNDVLNFAGNFVYMPWYSAFFTPDQIQQYGITLAPAVAQNAEEYAMQLRRAIIDNNIATHPIFTSVNDAPVLRAWAQQYDVTPVDAAEVLNRGLFDETTTAVLYRISVKDGAK